MVDIEDDPIELVASRHHEWEEQFHAERERIHSVVSSHSLETQIKRIEHIGSTAVPGLPAKDIVDSDIVVSDGSVDEISRTLQRELGGTRVENTED